MPVFDDEELVVFLQDVAIPSKNNPAVKYIVILFINFNNWNNNLLKYEFA
jgi:hypothetical protein